MFAVSSTGATEGKQNCWIKRGVLLTHHLAPSSALPGPICVWESKLKNQEPAAFSGWAVPHLVMCHLAGRHTWLKNLTSQANLNENISPSATQ